MAAGEEDPEPREGPAAPGGEASPGPAAGLGASFVTDRPVAVFVVVVAAILFGYFSYGRLAIRLMPEMSYPTVTVRTDYPGAAPEEVEEDVSRPIEEALGVVAGLRRISSISRADLSDVVLEFGWDTSMSDAVQDTLEKLDLVRLPDEVGSSLILRFDPTTDPVMELSLASTRAGTSPGASAPPAPGAVEEELRRLRRIGELQVKRALEPIKGVAAVRVRGGLDEEIHVLIDRAALDRVGLSIGKVIARLGEENLNVAGGTIEEGRAEYMVRTINEYQDLGQIADTVLTSVESRPVRVRDIARVERGHRERDMVTRTNGAESVQIDIFKEADANMVALSKRVRAALGQISDERPPAGSARSRRHGLAQQLRQTEQVEIAVVADRSLFIESSIDEVAGTAKWGGLLAVIVLFLFLRSPRDTVIIGLSIPISLLVTFALLNLLGISLNIMSLGGLALGVGMLVDSSIVVLESIHRNREEGRGLVAATILGTREVKGAVVASTLTTIGVFLPMVFVEGVAGQAFADLGLAVVLSLCVSLLVALYFIPMLASRPALRLGSSAGELRALGRFESLRTLRDDWRRSGRVRRVLFSPYWLVRLLVGLAFELVAKLVLAVLALTGLTITRALVPLVRRVLAVVVWVPLAVAQAGLQAANRLYPRIIRASLRRVGVVLAFTAAALALMVWSARRLDSELLPEVHQGEFTLEVALPVGTPIEQTEKILRPIEQGLLADRKQGVLETVIVTYGYDALNSRRSDEGEHSAQFKILVPRGKDNRAAEQAVAERLRTRLMQIPDVTARLTRPVLFSFKTPIEVEVYGDDLPRLRALADRVKSEMAAMPSLTDVETTLRKGAPEVQIIYHRDRLRRYGLAIDEVARRVRDQVKGRTATRFNQQDRRIPIVVRLRETDRRSVEDVQGLIVDPEQTGSVRLSSVADVTLGEGPSEVRRIDGQRVAVVGANLAPGASLGPTALALSRTLGSRIAWPDDVDFEIAGQNQEWERSRRSLWLALALSILLVYVIMAAQFESLLHPLIIILTIPLGFVGSFLTLQALGIGVSIVVFLGMIMLAGIVVNNAIVLVDYVNVLKRRGLGRSEALARAGAVRLRPILMTTATTVLGLLPMALGLGEGAEIRTPLAITVISGLVTSTLLTLVVIPTVYLLIDRSKDRVAQLVGLPGGGPPPRDPA